jgi:hypothetical protein
MPNELISKSAENIEETAEKKPSQIAEFSGKQETLEGDKFLSPETSTTCGGFQPRVICC